MDLTEDPAVRAQRVQNSLKRALPTLGDDEVSHATFANEFLVQRLRAEGAMYCANFVGRSERDTSAASTAQFVVLTKDGPAGVARPLDVAAEALRRENKSNRKIDFIDLPIGRCLVVLEDNTFELPTNLAGHKTDHVRHVRQIQVLYPLTDNGKLAFFELCTECLRDWDDYVQMMAAICKTIEWREPEPTNIGSVLDGL